VILKKLVKLFGCRKRTGRGTTMSLLKRRPGREEMADNEDMVEEEVVEDQAVDGEEATARVDEVIDDQDITWKWKRPEIEEEVDDHGITDTSADNVDITADEITILLRLK
jgi:hypothetical protein